MHVQLPTECMQGAPHSTVCSPWIQLHISIGVAFVGNDKQPARRTAQGVPASAISASGRFRLHLSASVRLHMQVPVRLPRHHQASGPAQGPTADQTMRPQPHCSTPQHNLSVSSIVLAGDDCAGLQRQTIAHTTGATLLDSHAQNGSTPTGNHTLE